MNDSDSSATPAPSTPKKRYVRAVGPRLHLLLSIVFALFALLGANSVYLGSITFLEWVRGLSYQNYFYQFMFLGHLALGLLLILPVVIFGLIHMKNAYDRPNRRAVRVGYALFFISLILLVTGVVLMRLGNFVLKDPNWRSVAYWAHVLTPLLAIWLYVLHRLAGPRIQWKVGIRWAGVVGALVGATVVFHSAHPQKNQVGSKEGEKYFEPSLARTASGKFIPAQTLMMDNYCLKCHPDAYQGWFHSSHHFSSFNNRPYLFSIQETRKVSLERDGTVRASRWCAGCHDVVPFLSGAFDSPHFDIEHDPTGQVGITCTACHAITHVGSSRGNADYTIDEPTHYPFAYSTNALLQWLNNQLVKAKPDFHKRTFLKPLHKSAEFCSTCHKVSIPYEVNHYKEWLRGQNHYDTFLLSGASGHGARSFYYPPHASENCASCHMPLQPSTDFGAKYFPGTNRLSIHDHLFPAANTGIAHLRGEPQVVKRHEEYLRGSVRLDIFGLKEGGQIDQPLLAPLRPQAPLLQRGKTYLFEIVLRTLRVGHPFTEGTIDSNEVWVDTRISDGPRVLGRSGGVDEQKRVDPWAHFVNAYIIDKDGNRIDRRNPQDIFTRLYDHQIPPGAGQAVHYSFTVPDDASDTLTVSAQLLYRKFDSTYLQYVMGPGYTNDLPVVVVASDEIHFRVAGGVPSTAAQEGSRTNAPSTIPEWQRWNDYGIGLFLEGDKGSEKGELIQAAQAFSRVEQLGRADGPLNLARVYEKEGRLDDTVTALQRAADTNRFIPPANRWTLAWLNGRVNKQNGFLDKAISEFRSILEDRYPELDQRGFDFSKDYVVINELGQTLFERAKLERGEENKAAREQFLRLALERFEKTLSLDSENLTAHYNLSLIYDQLGDEKQAALHRRAHERYRPDDNARDRAVTLARRMNPAADHATPATVIYSLQRPGAPGLGATPRLAGVAPLDGSRP